VRRSEKSGQALRLSTCEADVRRDKLHIVTNLKGAASPIVCRTKRNDIPASIRGAVQLNVGTDQVRCLAKTALLGTVAWECLAAKSFPMTKPTPALAGILAGVVYVPDFHFPLPVAMSEQP